MTSSSYVYVWAFQVKPGCEGQFEKAYGPAGEWVRLFQKATGYLRTDLLCDRATTGRYLTIDYWESESSYQQFRQDFDGEFRELDKQCEGLTESEKLIGHFDSLSGWKPHP
jgi:heme-degrading monooxygenase HmoA